MKFEKFLNERTERFNPKDKKISHLDRIDKIDFSGKIFISKKNSNTNMILIHPGDLVISGVNVSKGALSIYKGERQILATIHYSSSQTWLRMGVRIFLQKSTNPKLLFSTR